MIGDYQMIIYPTTKTAEVYQFKKVNEIEDPIISADYQNVYAKEHGDRMLEWGAKIFYVGDDKCLQLRHFASKFMIALFDFDINNQEFLLDTMISYMFYIYEDDKEMLPLIERLFVEHFSCVFEKLTDRSIIAAMNRTQWECLETEWLDLFAEDDVLDVAKVNKGLNEYLISTKFEGKTEYFCPKEKFRELLKQYYQ